MTHYKIKTVKDLLKAKLEEEIGKLEQKYRIPVIYPRSLEKHVVNNAVGEMLIIYKGDAFSESKIAQGILQDRDMKIGIIPAIRFYETNKNEYMTPEEWVEFVIDALSGIELDVNRPDRFTRCEGGELLMEKEQVWYYGVTLTAPVEYVEKQYRENL